MFSETFPHSRVDKKIMIFFFKAEALFFLLLYCMFRHSHNKIFWGLGTMKIVKLIEAG